MKEMRCVKCNKLLCKYDFPGNQITADSQIKVTYDNGLTIEIKCPRCGEMNTRKESVEDERGTMP